MNPTPPQLTIKRPEDAIAAVPYLLGFKPERSLVIIGAGAARGTYVLRWDVAPAEEHDRLVEHVADFVRHQPCEHAYVLGYGSKDEVTPLLAATSLALTPLLTVVDVVRVHDGRWWRPLCGADDRCDPRGYPCDTAPPAFAAQATVYGQVALPSREALARTVAAVTGDARGPVRAATIRAVEKLGRRFAEATDVEQLKHRIRQEGLSHVQDLLAQATRPCDDEVAWLGIVLIDLRIRDEAWARTEEAHVDFWRDVLCRVEEPYAAGPACLTAYAAYLTGNGALANVALDRAEAADPDYTMAGLLRAMMQAGVPPWKARLAMPTPGQLADQWDAAERRPHEN